MLQQQKSLALCTPEDRMLVGTWNPRGWPELRGLIARNLRLASSLCSGETISINADAMRLQSSSTLSLRRMTCCGEICYMHNTF